jgi:viroplasmin and RNaseH domain-containing protein
MGYKSEDKLRSGAEQGYEIYVDGSFINGRTGYGAVILKDGEVVDELSGAVSDPSVAYARQVAGELLAVEESLRWCEKHSVNEVSIFYDYYGIEKWATGRWKANQPLTVNYREFVRGSGVRVHWHKVNSHAGDRWNDRADALAKKGAGASLAPVASAADDERLNELMKKADAFIEFLMVKGIEAAFEKIYNDQFARLLIIENDKRTGIFDLYHTKKKPLSPYLHDFKEEQMKSRIESYWGEFR